MGEYSVSWDIEVIADSAEEAADIAWKILKDPGSMATVLGVEELASGKRKLIDMEDYGV